ncbi:MAG TPA: hypothetical protein VK968_00455 [Roseimicrobium sp.]|nr:hypothetical protein [Roseimicrobium sp.]
MKKILYCGLVLSLLSLVSLILVSPAVVGKGFSYDEEMTAYSSAKDENARASIFQSRLRSFGRQNEAAKKLLSFAAGLVLAQGVVFGLAIMMPKDAGTASKNPG